MKTKEYYLFPDEGASVRITFVNKFDRVHVDLVGDYRTTFTREGFLKSLKDLVEQMERKNGTRSSDV